MSVAETIAPELPYLRRFARALTGAQSTGDAHVVAMLEALVDGRTALAADLPARVALYRAFLQNFGAVAGLENDLDLRGPERAIHALTPLSRQAFLLLSLESFTAKEAAQILSITESEIQQHLDKVGREIAAHVATSALIIEDEPLIALDLEELLKSLGHSVLGVARTRDEAVAMAASMRPGLVLADIQLADGSSGLDAVNDILETFEVPVIFITAYPERLLTGARPEPAFLITKPFSPAMVKAVVSQVLFFETRARSGALAGGH